MTLVPRCKHSSRMDLRAEIINNLIDPTNNYMFVSNIKPCICQYELIRKTVNNSLNQL